MNGMTATVALQRARKIAEELLFPSAMYVDQAVRVPAGHLGALAEAGLYGLAGPARAGGLEADPGTFCSVTEIMAGGCLATTFVWLQHHSTVRALTTSDNVALRDAWLEPLCQGAKRAGIALGGARPGPPLLRATAVPGGYVFDGSAPWVTGWDMIDVVHTLARDGSGDLVAALLPARISATLAARRLELVAVNASVTVELTFTGYFVPAGLVTGVVPHEEWLLRDAAGLRPNGSLALGVAGRCCQLIGPGPLDDELITCRSRLDAADAGTLPRARATAAEFAWRAAGSLVIAAGSRSIVAGEHPQRLAREAMFLLVFGSRPAIKAALFDLVAAPHAAVSAPSE